MSGAHMNAARMSGAHMNAARMSGSSDVGQSQRHRYAGFHIASDDVQGNIGLRLRAVYDDMVSAPLPDTLRSLLESLDSPNTRPM